MSKSVNCRLHATENNKQVGIDDMNAIKHSHSDIDSRFMYINYIWVTDEKCFNEALLKYVINKNFLSDNK